MNANAHEMWSVGLVTFAIAAAAAALYLLGRGARGIGNWVERREGQKDRWLVKTIFFLVLGFVVGGFAQSWYDDNSACFTKAQGFVPCVLSLR